MKRLKTTVYKTNKQLIKSAIKKAIEPQPSEAKVDPDANLDFLQRAARRAKGWIDGGMRGS